MKYLLVYTDSYNRSESIRRFETKEKLDAFIKRDEVYNVIEIYELRKVQ